uniref:Uncharacterized protein n=1 Tax=Podoviridae sp. ctz6O13 TaxID=2827757 RepID=A0A8S5TK47_9CAUD|nr:MAG TPA: hypothetical protein [Podoviridae sp. ctz6O13]
MSTFVDSVTFITVQTISYNNKMLSQHFHVSVLTLDSRCTFPSVRD